MPRTYAVTVATALRQRWSLLLGMVLVVVAAVVVVGQRATAAPPVRPAAAGIRASVVMMPTRDVPSYLRSYGVRPTAVRIRGGTSIVARVSWRPLSTADASYTVLLAGAHCQAGTVDGVNGVPDRDVSLGNGSEYAGVLSRTAWLQPDADVRLSDGSDMTIVDFGSVRASHRGDVWVVGRLLDVCSVTSDGDVPGQVSGATHVVVGVALTTGDRVWWVRRAAG
jgi:hypothetical protein